MEKCGKIWPDWGLRVLCLKIDNGGLGPISLRLTFLLIAP